MGGNHFLFDPPVSCQTFRHLVCISIWINKTIFTTRLKVVLGWRVEFGIYAKFHMTEVTWLTVHGPFCQVDLKHAALETLEARKLLSSFFGPAMDGKTTKHNNTPYGGEQLMNNIIYHESIWKPQCRLSQRAKEHMLIWILVWIDLPRDLRWFTPWVGSLVGAYFGFKLNFVARRWRVRDNLFIWFLPLP